jgi:hypothetical protein
LLLNVPFGRLLVGLVEPGRGAGVNDGIGNKFFGWALVTQTPLSLGGGGGYVREGLPTLVLQAHVNENAHGRELTSIP